MAKDKTGGTDTATEQPAVAASAPAAEHDAFAHLGDNHWGQAGRYVVGTDGVRRPVTETVKETRNG